MKRKVREEMKQLESMKVVLEAKLASLKEQKQQLGQDMSSVASRLNIVSQRLKNLQTEKPLTVSEHALLRYIERVEGINLDDIAAKIVADDQLQEEIRTLGNGQYPVNHGEFSVVVRDNVVVTVVTHTKRDSDKQK